MKTYAFDFYNKFPNKILVFASRKEAMNYGNGWVLAANEEDLLETNISISRMAELYNEFNRDNPVKTFRDKPTAIARMISLAQAHAVKIEPQKEEEKMSSESKTSKPKKDKTSKPKKESSEGKKGRVSVFAGKKIFLSAEVEENPRRPGSKGFSSMEILLANKNGISYEDYIAAGGRRPDLAWDIAHGYAYVE